MERYTTKDISRFYKQGDFEKAYLALRAIIKDYPDNGGLYAIWAELEMRVKNNLSKAEYLINEAYHLGCPEGFYHQVRGNLFFRKHQVEQALTEYERSVSVEPSLDNLLIFAQALSAACDERAISVWESILQKDPKNVLAYVYLAREAVRRKDLSRALEMVRKAEQLKSLNAVHVYEIGTVYHILEHYEKAREYLLRAKESSFTEQEKLSSLYSQIASCSLRMDDGMMALEHALKAVKIEPKNDDCQKVLELCKEHIFWLCGEYKYSDAYPMMLIALEVWPDDGELLAYMAVFEMDFKHNYELGQSYMSKAFKCKNAELDILYEIKGSLWFDYLNDKQEGLACLEKAVALNRNKLNLHSLAYRIIDTDPERAQRIYDELSRSDPEDIDVICGLANMAMKQGNPAKGFELAKKSNELAPSNPRTSALLALAHFHLGRYKESLEFYDKAQELDFPDKAYIYNSIAECYLKLGKLRKARKYIKKALDINPNNPESKRLPSELR
jgi:tetratricopeptide (TPR) repeat protein